MTVTILTPVWTIETPQGVLTTVMMGAPGHMQEEDFTWPYIMFTKLMMHGVLSMCTHSTGHLTIGTRGVPDQ